ncbi:MAG: flagellar basal body rod protein FlgB [Agathobacter sp.]|nr:flagellar basal body rod protein FlgB [Agathobacter sp.]
MINSTAFNYINVLDKAADASWTRETLIANNIANVDTPGYKRQDIDFQSVLQDELGRCKHVSLDHKINNADLTQLNPQVYTDHSGFSYRLDGNNVDIDTENVELASEQLKYQALTSSIDSNFSRMKMVMK